MKKSIRAVLCLLFLTLIASTSMALNTVGYGKTSELKAWDDNKAYDIVMENTASSTHTCSGSSSRSYRLAKSETEMYRTLLAAHLSRSSVSLAYACNGSSIYADIVGIRLQ